LIPRPLAAQVGSKNPAVHTPSACGGVLDLRSRLFNTRDRSPLVVTAIAPFLPKSDRTPSKTQKAIAPFLSNRDRPPAKPQTVIALLDG